MKNQNHATERELTKALAEAPREIATTIGKVNNYALMRRALKAIHKGSMAFTF